MKATVYTLTDGETNEVFYVGQTIQPLDKRLAEHRCNYSHPSFRHATIEVIETCDIKDKFKMETYWIHQFKEWGFNLINNIRYGKKGAHCVSHQSRINFLRSIKNLTPLNRQ